MEWAKKAERNLELTLTICSNIYGFLKGKYDTQ